MQLCRTTPRRSLALLKVQEAGWALNIGSVRTILLSTPNGVSYMCTSYEYEIEKYLGQRRRFSQPIMILNWQDPFPEELCSLVFLSPKIRPGLHPQGKLFACYLALRSDDPALPDSAGGVNGLLLHRSGGVLIPTYSWLRCTSTSSAPFAYGPPMTTCRLDKTPFDEGLL